MIRTKTLLLFSMLTVGQLVWTATAEGGPLLDWLFQRNRHCRPVAPAPNCGTCTTTCQQTCQRVVVNYVPYTAYRASWERVPVTTYRQTSSTDPCTGCTVTCNRPCTTYSWRMKQEPFTTYRPVYRTETYQVPVTYTTPAPSVAAPACNTCAVPPVVQAPVGTVNPGTTYTPYYQQPANSGSVLEQNSAAGSTLSPADTIPTLSPQSSQKPVVVDGASQTAWPAQIHNRTVSPAYNPIQDPDPTARWNNNPAPQLLNPFNKSANVPSVERWNYSPVRQASYQAPVQSPTALQRPGTASSIEYVGSFQRQTSPQQPQRRVNEGWRND